MNFESGSVATMRRLTGFWLVVAIFIGTFTVAVPLFDNAATAVAQEDAAPDGDAAAAPAADNVKAPKPQKAKSALGWLTEALGIYLFVFLLISVALVSLIIMNFLAVRRSVTCPPDLIDGFQAWTKSNTKKLTNWLKQTSPFWATFSRLDCRRYPPATNTPLQLCKM